MKQIFRRGFPLTVLLTLVSGCAFSGPAPRPCVVNYPGAIPIQSVQPLPDAPLFYEAPLEQVPSPGAPIDLPLDLPPAPSRETTNGFSRKKMRPVSKTHPAEQKLQNLFD